MFDHSQFICSDSVCQEKTDFLLCFPDWNIEVSSLCCAGWQDWNFFTAELILLKICEASLLPFLSLCLTDMVLILIFLKCHIWYFQNSHVNNSSENVYLVNTAAHAEPVNKTQVFRQTGFYLVCHLQVFGRISLISNIDRMLLHGMYVELWVILWLTYQ